MKDKRVKWGKAISFAPWSLAVALLYLQAPPAYADAAAGKKIFEAKNCGSCHRMTGPTDPVPVTERAKIKGPPLWFAGSKFKKEWLTAWLAKPAPIRRVKYGTLTKGTNAHSSLSAADAAEVGSYLMSLTDSSVKAGAAEAGEISRRARFKAETLFAKTQVCFGCHEYPSDRGNIGGFTGPSLVGAGQRLQADWILSFLKNNVRYYPDGRMPVYGPQAFNKYSDEDIELLAQYVGNL